MNTLLDTILAKASRLTGAGGIMFVAKQPIDYQPGCGIGRPTYSNRFLMMHPKDADNSGTWVLPTSAAEVMPANAYVDQATEVVRCVEFAPLLGEKYDDASWHHSDFVVGHPWVHPDAQRAVESFEREHNYFDQPSSGELSMESRSEFTAAQSKADRVARAFGDSAEPPLQGESLLGYRVRLASQFQKHSARFKDANLAKIGDPVSLGVIEDGIFNDAMAALSAGTTVPAGQLRAIVTADPSGRPITKYVGDPNACWDQFNPPRRFVRRILTPGTPLAS